MVKQDDVQEKNRSSKLTFCRSMLTLLVVLSLFFIIYLAYLQLVAVDESEVTIRLADGRTATGTIDKDFAQRFEEALFYITSNYSRIGFFLLGLFTFLVLLWNGSIDAIDTPIGTWQLRQKNPSLSVEVLNRINLFQLLIVSLDNLSELKDTRRQELNEILVWIVESYLLQVRGFEVTITLLNLREDVKPEDWEKEIVCLDIGGKNHYFHIPYFELDAVDLILIKLLVLEVLARCKSTERYFQRS